MEALALYVKPLTHWLNLHPHYAGLITFLISFSESLAIIGSIIPGSVTMTAIGILVGSGVIPATSTFVWAILGAIMGDGVSYWLGRHYRDDIKKYWPFNKHPTILDKGYAFFKSHGGKSVFIGRFAGPARSITPLIAGMMNMSRTQFFIANFSSAIGWSILYILPGVLLGAAALELSPESASRIVLYVLLILVLIWLAIIVCKWAIHALLRFLDAHLEDYWRWMRKHPKLQALSCFLVSPDSPHGYGQLAIVIFLILSACAFIGLAINITFFYSLKPINDSIFHVLQSIRYPSLDNYFLLLSFLGDKTVVLPASVMVIAFLSLYRRYWTAIHFFVGQLFAASSIFLLKLLINNARPTGFLLTRHGSSFPSGHTVLSVTFYGLIAYLIAEQVPKGLRQIVYIPCALLILLIAFSRIYLGAHWFTDVLGGLFLGLSITLLVILSLRRHLGQKINTFYLLTATLVSLLLTYPLSVHLHFNKQMKTTQVVEKIKSVPLKLWWQGHKHLPLYRTNRLGQPVNTLNLQWASPLPLIEKSLQDDGWIDTANNPRFDWYKRIISSDKKHQLPLLPQLFNNRHPTITYVKIIDKNKPLIVLRLWKSNVILSPNNYPLWIGAIHYRLVWKHDLVFFKHKLTLPKLDTVHLLSNILSKFEWKTKTIPSILNRKLIALDNRTLLLIKQ